MDRASCDEAEIPHGPPDGAIAKAARAYPWTPVVQIIGADPFTTEQTLIESSVAVDVPLAQRPPFLRFQTHHIGNLLGVVVALKPGSWQTGNLSERQRAAVAVLVSETAKVPAGAFAGYRFHTEEQPGAGANSHADACSSSRRSQLLPAREPCDTSKDLSKTFLPVSSSCGTDIMQIIPPCR